MFDYPPAKKPRTARLTPDVHIALNIAPTLASDLAHPAEVSQVGRDALVPHPVLHQPRIPSKRPSLILTLLECLEKSRVPTALELLALMDADQPAPDLKYVDVHSELADHGINDALDVHLLPVEYLATFGCLGRDGATCLHQYARKKMLAPLGLLEAKRSDTSSSVVEITKEEMAVKGVAGPVAKRARLCDNDRENAQTIKQEETQEVILRWLEDVRPGEPDIEGVDEVSSSADDDDVATASEEI